MHRKREQTVYAGIVEATYLDDRVSVELIADTRPWWMRERDKRRGK